MTSSNHTNVSNPSLDVASFKGSSIAVSAAPSSPRPFYNRAGRTYLADPNIPYPLPVDLPELHRQSLRTLLLIQIFGAPVCSPVFAQRPPTRVLEVACGTGFWSMMCHRYFASRGHPNVSFTGLDIAPLAARCSSKPDRDMKWRFVQHDMRCMPWPLPDDGFDLIMVKDVSMALPASLQQSAMDEYIRLLRPGGVLEIWDSDHQIRMLRPHAPAPGGGPSRAGEADDSSTEDEADAASSLGAYVMTANTPLSAPLNGFLVEYNGWLNRALNARDFNPVPCTVVGPMLLQESEELCDVRSRRLAVPLAEVRWEREGVGGTLTASQAAVRRTAMLTVVQLIQSLEPVLRETSGKSQDEWDTWMGKMMNDLMRDNGASCGECLEVGAWWARKKGGVTRS
ncbi:hypothetical protein ACRALDRAFT_2101648 [Sodiomyces alcalophilus JCM 7366]|uniref:uncharacterized protein n=1 Tax=Sodiomyces alcalophilus JCM 7366 TaxID=591952 RepID=UPI0039B4D3F4